MAKTFYYVHSDRRVGSGHSLWQAIVNAIGSDAYRLRRLAFAEWHDVIDIPPELAGKCVTRRTRVEEAPEKKSPVNVIGQAYW